MRRKRFPADQNVVSKQAVVGVRRQRLNSVAVPSRRRWARWWFSASLHRDPRPRPSTPRALQNSARQYQWAKERKLN